MTQDKLQFGPYTVELSHTKKIFFPDSKITKGDLIEYYRKISDIMLPQMRDRVITMHRYPDGIEGEGFYQKEVPDYFPEFIYRVEVEKKSGGFESQAVCNNAATLVYLANQACVTPISG